MDATLERKPLESSEVEKFRSFKVEDGKLMGYTGDRWLEIESILYHGNGGDTTIDYWLDGELHTMVQSKGKGYENMRVYG